jgi:hypothetical protein
MPLCPSCLVLHMAHISTLQMCWRSWLMGNSSAITSKASSLVIKKEPIQLFHGESELKMRPSSLTLLSTTGCLLFSMWSWKLVAYWLSCHSLLQWYTRRNMSVVNQTIEIENVFKFKDLITGAGEGIRLAASDIL